ncbi:hypothetical protein BY996DRAFT_4588871 [Phakopsora pachyrhizi]|uniref:RRM domain-containing protein n=1 Tax=Phakopsora pachyrhizi TaxID=170000 RepID=A0AAV0BEJ4_PHAPC|nr:hypothetical protein BY996DRAFT_4604079 [Phakopsora pachyrhizi]KAI8449594.1 hypothetical protein BY996DRAFT_4588871 [Phakopsora pachyrhizi]CAH7684831.1 hypothetical protein PPACK8108_LOCUS19259 [Phakopsora pachyrhizi]
MISKQLARTTFQALKSTTSSSGAASGATRVAISSLIRATKPNRCELTPIRLISSCPIRFEESASSNISGQPTNISATTGEEFPHAVYLSNLSFAVTEELLTEFLKQHVPVKKVDIVRNPEGAARGFGFAKFTTLPEAEEAVKVINGLDFLGRQVVAAISQKRPVLSDASNQLFMSGFPVQGEADEAVLRKELNEKLGFQPRVIRFHRFPGGFLKGTGHIEFEDAKTLEQILVKLQELGPTQPISVNGHILSLVKARPLLQPRNRAGRGGFAGMRGRGGYGGQPGYGAQYGGQYGDNSNGYGATQGGDYQGQGYNNSAYDSPYPPFSQGSGGYDSRGSGGNSGGNSAY